MFHPEKFPRKFWNAVLACLLIYTASIMPFRMAFVESELYDDWFYVESVIDLLFFCDVLVNCTSAYFTSEGVLITDRCKIF